MLRTRNRWIRNALLVAVATGAGLFAGSDRPAEAFPMPDPTYDILAVSNGHEASLLNLGLGMPGAPQVPVPVDVDGDLLPDVTVAVNLLDPVGGIDNPPDVPGLLVPNVEINRILTGHLLGQAVPPLRIEIQLRLVDAFGTGPDTTLRFGYDTGPGGSIPPNFKARLGGIEDFFNPLIATVDTGPSSGRPQTYDGPLRLVGGLDSGDTHVDLGLGFSPLPREIEVGYGTDDEGQHITYEHRAFGLNGREVDARAEIDLESATGATHVDARIDRLPSAIEVDIASPTDADGEEVDGAGAISWRSSSDGRRPDLEANIASTSTEPDTEPLYAAIDLDSLPPTVHAAWSLPEDGPIDVTFHTGDPGVPGDGQGIGGVDVDIRNHPADHPDAIERFVPEERQYLSVRQEPGSGGEELRRITGRVERIRAGHFSDADGVLAAELSMGDGESPLQVEYDCRVGCSEDGSTRLVDVAATVSPLPADFTTTITDAGADPRVAPMLIDYTASSPVDVEASIGLAQAGSTGTAVDCGAVATVCADLEVRDLPQELHASLGQYASPHEDDEVPEETDLRLGVDLVGHDGAAPIAPDLTATVVLGPDQADQPPLVADAEVTDLADHLRVYLHQHREETEEGTHELALDRAAFHACVRAVDAEVCEPGTEGEIGAVAVSLRSFLDRPTGFPVPLHDRPQYATVQSRPNLAPGAPSGARHLEVGARVQHVSDLEYLNTGAIQGVFAAAGDGATPFTARIDIEGSPAEDVELDPTAAGDDRLLVGVTRDLRAEAEVTDLPPSFGVCFRTPHVAMTPVDRAFTRACEETDFDDDPLAFAYELDVEEADTVEVDGTFATTLAGTLEVDDEGEGHGDAYAETLEGQARVPDVPSSVVVQASLPEEDTVGPIDAVYDASDSLDIDFSARVLVDDSECLDPRATAEAMCVEAYLDDIPSEATVFYDPTSIDDNLRVHTDYDLDDDGEPDDTTTRLDLREVSLTSVRPRVEPIEEPVPTPAVLIVEGEVINLPADVHGTIVTPDDDGDGDEETQPAKTLVVCASAQPCDDGVITDEIGRVTLHARNVVVADPTPLGGTGSLTPQRAGLPGPTDEVIAYGRGGAFHAFVDLEHISNVGYRQIGDAAGTKLETEELQLGFGPLATTDQVIRAFVDLDEGTARTIADVTLQDVPQQTTFCFRGADLSTGSEPAPGTETFCDTAPEDHEGAVQVTTVPRDGADGLDLDAFLRATTGGDAAGIAARVVAGNVPATLEGTIPAEGRGSLDLAGYDTQGQPDGFDQLSFEIANFDIADTGYAVTPWNRTIGKPSADFPAPSFPDQHLSVVATDRGFHARGQVDGLRRIALRDGLCSAVLGPDLTGDGQPDPRADYPYYPPAVEGTQPYTCIRTEFDGEGAGEHLDLRAFVRAEDGEVLSLTDAGIDRLPEVMQLTLADIEPLGPAPLYELKAPCPTAGAGGPAHDGCLPPMARVDVEAADPSNPPEVFGVLRIGSDEHLVELGEAQARGNPIENAVFDATIDTTPPLGVNAKVGTWTDTPGYEEVEEGTAVIARMRLPLPYSITVDTPQTWSDDDGAADEPTFRATDLRMHYVARSGPDTVVPSLGTLRLLVHSEPDNTQTLLHGGGIDGLNIPGELAVAVYLRDDVAEKRLYAQIDGAVSSEVNLVASILGATPPTDPFNLPEGYERPMDRMTFEVRHLPAGPFGGWDAPGFRIQAEVIDDSPPPEDCSATSCSVSESSMREVRGLLDLRPGDGPPARKVHAVVRTLEDGPLGIQVAGYQNLSDQPNGTLDDGNAEITLAGDITIDPLYAYTFEGVPFLANYEVELDTSLHVGMSVDRASDFQLFSNKLGVVTNFDGSGSAVVGPLDLRPELLYVDVTFLGGTVFGLDLSPFYDQSTPLDLDFFSCDTGDVVGSAFLDGFAYGSTHLLSNLPWNDDEIAYEVGQGRDDTLIFPELDLDTMIPSGPGGFLADAFPSLRMAIGCGMFDTTEVDLINSEHPGVSQATQGHVVPGSTVTIDTPPEVQQPPDADGLTEIGTEAMCGRNIYQGTVRITGTVSVAADPADATFGDCLPGFGGTLEIVADAIEVEPGASIDADEVVDVSCTSPFGATSTYDFALQHEPDPNAAWGTAFTPNFGQCESFYAGGGGAGHTANGGTAGPIPFAAHVAYDGHTLTRNDPGIVSAGYEGGGGSGVGGGRGGGVVRLVADRVQVDGTITAVGGDAGDAPLGPDDDPCSSGTTGGGGGSGGGITVAANRIDIGSGAQLLARGGAGGAGATGGGGGSGGDIELLAGLIATAGAVDPTANFTFIAGGSGGTGCAPFFVGTGGGDGHERAEERPQSSVLPLGNGPGGLWWTNNDTDGDGAGEVVNVPVVATASDGSWAGGNDTGVTIALCGVLVTPETQDAEGGFRALTPNIPSSGNLCGLRSFSGIAGFGAPTGVLLGHTYVADDNDVTPEDGVTIPVAGFDATAYVGLYTVAVRSDLAGNDCFDGDLFDFTCFGRTSVDPDNDCDDPYDWVGLGEPWSLGYLYYDPYWGIFEQNPGREYDRDVCVYDNLETPPGDLGPDLIIGMDNDAPDPDDISITYDPYDAAQIDGDTMWNNLGWIEGTVAGNDRVPGTGVFDLSGVDHFECFQRIDGEDHYFPCDDQTGFETSTRGGEGEKVVGVTAVDRVGNRTTILDTTIVVDTTVPSSAIVPLSPPDRANGWYSASPQFQLSGFPDPAPGSLEAPPHPDHRYVYQIDDGPEIDCEPSSPDGICTITGDPALPLPGPGSHRIWYTAVDRAGNRGERCDECFFVLNPMGVTEVGIDAEAPVADTFAAPGLPDGANDWYVTEPHLGVGFADPPVGGAGIRLDRDPSVLQVAVVPGGSTLDDADYADYSAPIRLGAGVHDVTARARDDAGNPWPPGTPPQAGPTRTYRVDPLAPLAFLSLDGPLGSGGWYTGPVTVTVGGLDLPVAGGSGIDPSEEGSGLFVSVDDGPFLPIAVGGSLLVQEGEHVVRAYAVDVAGNQSAVSERAVRVDRSRPVSELRTLPADPARGPWFRTRPVVVLRATDGDANAGVASIRYCFGAGCTPTTTYSEPFTAPEGRTTIRWRALDASGSANDEPIRTLTVHADTAPPVAVATSPSKLVWLRLKLLGIQLGQPSEIQLRFTVSDAQAGPLRAQVVVFDTFGNPVRRIDAAPIDVAAGQTVTGSVNWDGRMQGLANLVPLGVYHYRVVVTDQAGNITESGESQPITIKLL